MGTQPAKTKPYTIRLTENAAEEIAAIADSRGIPARTLVRVWIGERLAEQRENDILSPSEQDVTRFA